MAGFDTAHEAMEKGLSESSPVEDNREAREPNQQADDKQARAQAIIDLEKTERFKFDGQEMTAKDLKAAMMRMKDYTQKTQGLAEERKSFANEQKFYENLAWDLKSLEANPSRINEFISIYPQKFHQYAQRILEGRSNTQQPQGQQQNTQGQIPVQFLSKLDRLEKAYNEQETAKVENQIKQTMTDMGAKYPDFKDLKSFNEMILGRAYESHSQGVQLTPEAWADIYKGVADDLEGVVKARYGNMVKKQTEANNKSRDVGSGGGTPGSAPQKFKKLSDVTKFAIDDLTAKHR